MSNSKSILFILLVICLSLFISSCTINFKGADGATDGGLYVSRLKGDTWNQKVLVPTITGRPLSIHAFSANSLVMDPSDNNAIYFGSVENGLFYSYNSGTEWQKAKGLGRVSVRDVAVDFDSKCIIYVAVNNKVYKSNDCNRTWKQIYYDNDVSTIIHTIAIDKYNCKNLYIGTSRGEIIHSVDRGISWQTMNRFKNSVKKIIINPHDTRTIIIATSRGIHRSKDQGKTWVDLEDNLKEITKRGSNFRDIIFSESENGLVLLASEYGILKSKDHGDNWEKIELITPEKKATIFSIAMSPKDAKEIYYVTNTTFYRSLDGGENWTTKKLPTSRAGSGLLIDPKDTSIIYMGTKKLK